MNEQAQATTGISEAAAALLERARRGESLDVLEALLVIGIEESATPRKAVGLNELYIAADFIDAALRILGGNELVDYEARSAKGVKEYGTRLCTFNGRDAVEDAREELLDASQYTMQAILEKIREVAGTSVAPGDTPETSP